MRLFLFLALFSVVPFASANQAPCKSLLVSGNSEYPPLVWRNSQNPDQLIGALPALLEEILLPMGVETDTRHFGSWARVQRLAETGDIDVVAGIFISGERFKYMDYILPPIIHLPTAIWVPSGEEFLYRHWPDLKAKTGTTLIGYTFGENFDRFARKNLEIEPVRSIDQSFLMAEADRVDYVLYEKLQGQVRLARAGKAHAFSALKTPISTEGLFFTFSKKSRCNDFQFRERIAGRLYTLVNNGRVEELVEEYTSRYISEGSMARP